MSLKQIFLEGLDASGRPLTSRGSVWLTPRGDTYCCDSITLTVHSPGTVNSIGASADSFSPPILTLSIGRSTDVRAGDSLHVQEITVPTVTAYMAKLVTPDRAVNSSFDEFLATLTPEAREALTMQEVWAEAFIAGHATATTLLTGDSQ